jgi:hypothetical protein
MSQHTAKVVKVPLYLRGAAVVIVGVLIYLHIRYPSLSIDMTVAVLLFLLLIVWILPYVKSFTLPGGAGIELREKVDDAERKLAGTNPLHNSEKRMLVNKEPTISEPTVTRDQLLEQDPSLALASLRIELEGLLRDVGRTRSLFFPRGLGMAQMVDALEQRKTLTTEIASALRDVVYVCNEAIHGTNVAFDTARRTLNAGQTIVNALKDIIDQHEMTRQR